MTYAGCSQVNLDDDIDYLGEISARDQSRNPNATKIRTTPYNGELDWSPKTKPANLEIFEKDGKIIDPLKIAIRKQFVPSTPFEADVLHNAYLDYSDTILAMDSPYKHMSRKVLTEDENLNGIPGDPFLSRMNPKTSPGYPYTKHPLYFSDKRGKKHGFFNETSEGIFSLKSEIRKVIEEKEEAMMNGIIPPFIWTDNMKDERLPVDKVDTGKVRVFNCGPLDLSYLTRKYFLNFIAHCMHNNTGEVSCGINPHSISWKVLHKRLCKHGKDRIIAGDYSSYDKRLPFDVIMKVLDVIQSYYNDEFYMIRRAIFLATFNAIHLCGRSLYRCFRGNPSGTPLTTIVNCCVNGILFRYSYMFLARDHNVDPFTFRIYVEFAAYGDDNISGVSCNVPWFNAMSFQHVMSLYDIVYTSCSKGNIDVEYENIDDVTFLKRAFVMREGWMFAPLDRHSIEETMQWCKPSSTPFEEVMQSTFDSFCLELVHHGKPMFTKYVDHVMEVSQRLSPPIPLRRSDYNTLLANMINQSF
jgi:hypothetical protein